LAAAAALARRPLGRMPERSFLVLLTLAAAALRLAWVAADPNKQVSDYAIYHELAAALARGQGYVTTGPIGVEDLYAYIGSSQPLPYTTAYRLPGAPLWGAALYTLFGADPLWFKLANVLLGAGTCLLLYGFLKRGLRPEVARLAALGWALYPESVFASSLVCTEILFSFLLALLALSLDRTRGGRPRPAVPLLQGLLVACCALVRPLFLPILAALAALWWFEPGGKEAGRRLGLVLLGFLLGLAPWTWRNWRSMRAFIPISTTERITVVEKSYYDVPDDARNDPAWKSKWEAYKALPGETARYQGGYPMARENLERMLLGGPLHVARRLAANLLAAFADDVEMLRWSVTNSFYLARRAGPPTSLGAAWIDRWGTLDRAFYLAVVLAAAAGALLRGGFESGGFEFLVYYFLFNFALLLLLPGESRYHFPLMLVLIPLAARASSTRCSRILGLLVSSRGSSLLRTQLRVCLGFRLLGSRREGSS
jgi:hypothetical protein